MPAAGYNMDALITASQAARLTGVTVAAVCNWVARGYLRPACDRCGREIRDTRGCKLYRVGDVLQTEKATHERAEEMARRMTRRFPIAA